MIAGGILVVEKRRDFELRWNFRSLQPNWNAYRRDSEMGSMEIARKDRSLRSTVLKLNRSRAGFRDTPDMKVARVLNL